MKFVFQTQDGYHFIPHNYINLTTNMNKSVRALDKDHGHYVNENNKPLKIRMNPNLPIKTGQ